MHARFAAISGAVIMTAGLAMPQFGRAAPASAAARACATWHVVASPARGTLNSVAATSRSNAWAVGWSVARGVYRSLIEHWNSGRWSMMPSPDPAGSFHTVLQAAVGLSARNAWAFGFYQKRTTSFRTLAAHWNGSTWSVIPSPNVGSGENTFAAATAISASDIWAVGYHGDPGHRRPLTEHWDGSKWSVVSSPSVGSGDNFLFGAAAAPDGRVWAAGTDSVAFNRTLAMTWTGSAWSVTPTANPGSGDRFLQAVAAPGNIFALAVGSYLAGGRTRTLTERWTGGNWKQVPSPSPGADYNSLQSVAARSGVSAWAVGASRHDLGAHFRTLAEYWNGRSWVKSATPSPGGGDDWLFGVSAIPRGGYWAVGEAADRTLIERRC